VRITVHDCHRTDPLTDGLFEVCASHYIGAHPFGPQFLFLKTCASLPRSRRTKRTHEGRRNSAGEQADRRAGNRR